MGPSGAGKDSLLDWLRERMPAGTPVHWARRTVTRPCGPGDTHEWLDDESFEAQDLSQAFAMAWRAHGLRYGVRHGQLAPLARGSWVVVNGSRGYFEQARRLYPGLAAVHVSAAPDVLWQRLSARHRESTEQIAARIERSRAFEVPTGVLEVRNEGRLEDAGQQLLQALRDHAGWPG